MLLSAARPERTGPTKRYARSVCGSTPVPRMARATGVFCWIMRCIAMRAKFAASAASTLQRVPMYPRAPARMNSRPTPTQDRQELLKTIGRERNVTRCTSLYAETPYPEAGWHYPNRAY